MKRIRIGILFLFLSFLTACTSVTSFVQAEPPKVLVNSSHSGTIHDLIYDAERNLLFSGGEDGTIRIWDPSKQEILYYLRVSHRPIQSIAVHPHLPQLAVLEGNKLETHRLSVWDWEKKSKLFSINTGEQLLFLTYSSQGNYLLFSKADYKSLTVFNPQTGREFPYLREGFGIVSYIVVSRNEVNIMTYQPSGWITYRDLRTGKKLKQVKTLPNLSSIRISPNNRYIAASTGESLVMVDLLTGAVTAQTGLSGITHLAVSPLGNQIAGIAETGKGTKLRRFYFSGESLIEFPVEPGNFLNLSCLCFGQKNPILADRSGSIYHLKSNGKYGLLAQNKLLEISDLAFWENSMAVGGPDHILIFSSDFFSSISKGTSFIHLESFENIFSSPVGLDFLDARRLLVWRKDEDSGIISMLDPKTGDIEPIASDLNSPIIQLDVTKEGIITVEKSGLCSILDIHTFTTSFQYLSPGMNRLVSATGDTLIGGKSSISAFGSPLLQINQITGETVSISDHSLFIYDLIFNGRTNSIISLGVERNENKNITQLKLHFGPGFEKEKILNRFEGEDLSASLAIGPLGKVYSSLGYNPVKVWDGNRLLPLEISDHIPRKLYIAGGKLISLNRDYSITVWDMTSRRIIYEFYIFRDEEGFIDLYGELFVSGAEYAWAAFSPGGKVYASHNGKKYLSIR